MHAVGSPSSRTAGLRRDSIIEAAKRLFTERGYQATTLHDIGAAVGISGPALYRHFASKQALFIAVAEEGLHDFLGPAEELRSKSDSPIELVHRLVELNVRVIIERRELNAATWVEARSLGAAEARSFRDLVDRYLAMWEEDLAAARPDQSRDRVRATAEAVHWLMRSSCFFETHLDDDQLIAFLTEFTMGAILAGMDLPPPSGGRRGALSPAQRARTRSPKAH